MARTSGVEPGEFEVGPFLRPGERGCHRLAQTILGNRLEAVGPRRDPLLRHARVDHEPVVELVGRLPRTVVVDLEVQLEVRRLLPSHVDDQLEPPPGPLQRRDPLDRAAARLALEWSIDDNHEVEVALAGPVAADQAGAEHERIEHIYLLVDRGHDVGAVGLGGGVQVCRSHGDHPSNATLPAAIVSRTRPLTVWPSSQEFAERERKSLSETRLLAFRSSRTRFAGAPMVLRGASRPYARAGPADIRSSSVSSFSSPGSTRCV